MSYESDECKLLIDEAIHDYLHDDTETEMTVKDWFYDLRKQATKADEYEAKAKAFDKYHATISSHLHLKSEPEFSSPPTEVLSDIIDIHNEYESGDYDVKK